MAKRVLVTGGLGFIGHQVVRYLEAQDCEVCVVDPQTDYTVLPSQQLAKLYQLRKQCITGCRKQRAGCSSLSTME